eukprot:1146757-Amphidinium_carterae.1
MRHSGGWAAPDSPVGKRFESATLPFSAQVQALLELVMLLPEDDSMLDWIEAVLRQFRGESAGYLIRQAAQHSVHFRQTSTLPQHGLHIVMGGGQCSGAISLSEDFLPRSASGVRVYDPAKYVANTMSYAVVQLILAKMTGAHGMGYYCVIREHFRDVKIKVPTQLGRFAEHMPPVPDAILSDPDLAPVVHALSDH